MIRVSYGTWYEELRAALRSLAPDCPTLETRVSTCWCGSNAFWLETDATLGAACRVCLCGLETPLIDSAASWALARPKLWRCRCGNETANVGAGFCCPPPGHAVERVYLVARCAQCGIVAPAAEWQFGYEPSRHLMENM